MIGVIKKEIRTQTGTAGRPCEDMVRRWPSLSQGEKPEVNHLATTLILDVQCWNHKAIHVCCLSHSVCGICYGSLSKRIQSCIYFLSVYSNHHTLCNLTNTCLWCHSVCGSGVWVQLGGCSAGLSSRYWLALCSHLEVWFGKNPLPLSLRLLRGFIS